MSDDSDSEPIRKPTRSNKKIYNVDVSPSSTSSSGSFVVTHKKKCVKYICDDSDSDSSLDVVPKKKRLKRFVDESDDASDSSGSSIVRMGKKPISAKFIVESDQTDESDVGFEGSSEWENDEFLTGAQKSKSETKKDDAGTSTDSSNDDTEKCPICLMPFKQQEIGSPESCDHNFCVKCIQEWSKNNNTCPVDRRPFTLILVRKNLMSKIVRQIPVEMPVRENDQNIVSFDDRSFCEICGSDDREDRMLLCDGCDLAFHLECLTPPLTDVPPDAWYCPDCDSVVNNYQPSAYIPLPFVSMPRHRNLNRLAPRTRQNERLRARIAERRNNENEENNDALLEENLDAEAIQEPSTSRNGSLNNGQTRNRNARQQRKRKKKRAKRVKITYEVDPATGETIAVKKTVRKRKSRRQRERVRAQTQKKSVKKRLAAQLGICRQRTENQHTPDVRAQIHIDSINQRRFQAGIPTLHLFGRREELDYFSESETEFDASNILVRRRRPNMSDLSVMRRSAQRKRALLPAPSSTTGSDLLGSILESQMKFHSKHSVFILNKDGSVQVELNRNIPDLTRNNNSNVNINNHHSYVRQVPMYPNSTASDSTTQNEISDHGYQTNSSNGQNSPDHNNFVPTSTISGRSSFGTASGSVADSAKSDDYSSDAVCSSLDSNKKDKNKKEEKAALSRENTPCSMVTHNSDSEFDIYSDIETVSTSKVDDIEMKQPSPAPIANLETDEEQHESDTDLVIDTEKFDPAPVSNENDENTKEEAVSSTVDSIAEVQPIKSVSAAAHSTTEIQSETVQSSSQNNQKDDSDKNSDDDSEDGCPNFSIYSSESINLAKTTELSLQSKQNEQINSSEISSTPPERDTTTPPPPPPPPLVLTTDNKKQDSNEIAPAVSEKQPKSTTKTGLYSDSEDESIIKIDTKKPFGIGDLRNMTEDISEEERSYTPCLDEKDVTATTTNDTCKQGIEGLDTEMISDEDRNDFDESHELKTASDGDALEINAKESELDFTRPEDYEEGEIVDKVKANKKIDETNKENETKKAEEENKKEKKSKKSKEAENDKTSNKENESQNKENKESTFKKLSKSNKERNYRDKDRSRSKERKDKSDKNNAKEKKERRREIERYDVRSLIAEKPRRVKDQFGRDEVRKRSLTPSSRSASPYRSVSRGRRSYSRENIRKRRGRSRDRRSVSRSRSRSHERKRSLSKSKKRRRSLSKERPKRKKSRDRSKNKTKKTRSISRHRSRSVSPKRRRNWERRRSRDWTPSLSRSKSPVPLRHNISPSWTPPRLLENQPVKPHNLTVILTNDSTKKRKDKKKKSDKKQKDAAVERQKKRRRDRTPLPSKEVFASGDNILVSVSFNKDTEERDVTTTKRKRDSIDQPNKKSRKEKRASKNKKKSKDVSSLKPVAIIDLERSPFRVIIPSPKDVIVLSDSENGDSNTNLQKSICDSSAQAASPEQSVNNAYSMGPKTPPEPQVKFSLNAKPPQLRPISNPLHEPDDVEPDIDPQEELEQRLNEVLHKGPNTPPEPPNSPPSSPDAYDPFDPTKSRSPTPEPIQNQNQSNSASMDDNREDSLIESRPGMGDAMEKTTTPHNQQTPDATKSHTPPIADVQPADSQSSSHPLSPDAGKSPERINVVINQVVQSQASTFPAVASKPVAQTTPYSSVAPTLITSTPISSSLPAPRINILSSTILTSSPHVASSVPQRIVLPNTSKSSPVKISPTKPPIKSTPIKPMPTKNVMNKPKRKSNTRNQIANEISDVTLDFESPYSPRSSDYEDLFDPPTESYSNKPPANTSKTSTQQNKNTKSPAKIQNAFDALFGSSPVYNKQKNNKDNKKFKKVNTTPVKGTKQVGVKLDEDSLKILDELPNSAVEMQVKDKFLKKLNRQERVVEEVKLVLKPHYNKKRINKEEYKDILRRAVPKICHNKSGEINPKKIQNLIEAYVKKVRHSKKVTSSSSVNPQKVEGKHGRSNKTLVDQTVENWLDTINRNTAVGHT